MIALKAAAEGQLGARAMSYDPLEEAFNDALEESGMGLGFGPEGFGPDGFEPEGFGPDGFGPGDGYAMYENEGDAFFGKAFRSLGGLVKKLPLRQLAQRGAMIAGGALGGPLGAKLGGMVGGMLGENEAFESESFEAELGFEGEEEAGMLQEDEAEAFGLDSFTDSLAESLATQAAESESEAESSALLGGVTIHILTNAPVSVRRVSPTLVRSANRLGRYLRRERRTRPLLKAIPTIQKRAVKMLTKHAQVGGKVTPAVAAKAMAKATASTLGTPKAAAKSLANNAVKSRRVATTARPAPRQRSAIARAER
jgi:hypothetical protein